MNILVGYGEGNGVGRLPSVNATIVKEAVEPSENSRFTTYGYIR